MKFAIGLIGLAFVAVAQCGYISVVPGQTTLLRTPQHDSAVIHSERVNGNFAYSTVEGHAYQAITPLQHVVHQPVVRTVSARKFWYSTSKINGNFFFPQVVAAPSPVVRYSWTPEVIQQVANPWVYSLQSPVVHPAYPGVAVAGVPHFAGVPTLDVIPVEEAQDEGNTEEVTEGVDVEGKSENDDSVSVESA